MEVLLLHLEAAGLGLSGFRPRCWRFQSQLLGERPGFHYQSHGSEEPVQQIREGKGQRGRFWQVFGFFLSLETVLIIMLKHYWGIS